LRDSRKKIIEMNLSIEQKNTLENTVQILNTVFCYIITIITLFLVNSKSIVASAIIFMRSSKASICLGLPACAISETFRT
jgi:hypothetical protein